MTSGLNVITTINDAGSAQNNGIPEAHLPDRVDPLAHRELVVHPSVWHVPHVVR